MELNYSLITLLMILHTAESNPKCLLVESDGKEAIIQSPGYPDGYGNNLHLCWVIRSASEGDQVRLTVTESHIQPRSYSGEWTDYALVSEGDCTSGRVIRRWSGKEIPDSIQSNGGSLCLKFITDGSIRDRGFVITHSNTGGEGISLATILTIVLTIIGVSTVTIVAIVMYLMCRRKKSRQAASNAQRTTLPDDPLDDDTFPPSYSVAVRGQGRTVQTVSGTLEASGGDTNLSGELCKDTLLLDRMFGAEVPEPPSYTAAVNEPVRTTPALHRSTPALHRSPPGDLHRAPPGTLHRSQQEEYEIPGISGSFQPF